jgi:N-acetylglucosaminyldiphosphoundecaprenol N-acetyl-beta-D-mannosaminyltransferase
MLYETNTRAIAQGNKISGLAFPFPFSEPAPGTETPARVQPLWNPPNQLILGVPISLIDLKTALGTILGWTQNRIARYVCIRDVHGLMISLRDPAMMDIHRAAGMITPDGMPLVWISKWRSKLPVGRVCGTDLVDALCKAGQGMGLRHYFFGGKPGVAEQMIRNLKAKYPELTVAGSHTPPFRSLTEEEDAAVIDAINKSGAQVVWVGLSTPKQEFWMRDHVGRLNGATLIGVGAAFDFHSGAVTRAPKWMQQSGLEWLHRLLSEPRRLWRRYLVIAPAFILKIVREEIGFLLAKKSP